MANNEENGDHRDRESAQVGKALDSLTDRVAEKDMDQSKAKAAVQRIQEAKATDAEKQRLRAKELAAVKISKDDVKVITSEFGLTDKVSECKLRENGGDLERTLRQLLNQGIPEV